MTQTEALEMITKLQLAGQAMEAAGKRIDELKAENKALKEATQRPVAEPHKWVGLTDEERQQIVDLSWRQAPSIEAYVIRSMQYAEAKLKEKNT